MWPENHPRQRYSNPAFFFLAGRETDWLDSASARLGTRLARGVVQRCGCSRGGEIRRAENLVCISSSPSAALTGEILPLGVDDKKNLRWLCRQVSVF